MSRITPPDVRVLHAVRTLGYADAPRIAAHTGLTEADVHDFLLIAEASGLSVHTSFGGDGGWSVTEIGRARGERLLSAELDASGARAAVEQAYREFVPLNVVVAEACTAWQLGEIGIGQNPPTLAGTIAVLEGPATSLAGIENRLTTHLQRFGGYHRRFSAALTKAHGDSQWITGTDRDSSHRVWFELHEDFIATLGLTR